MSFSVPSMNLYKIASKLIGKSEYEYFVASRTLDVRGMWVTTYDTAVTLNDSIQAVPRALYSQLGLDLDKYYIMIYTDNSLVSTDRDISGDQIEFNGERYQLQSPNDWNPISGWRGVLAVRQLVTGTP